MTYVILETVDTEDGTHRTVVPRGRVYESPDSAARAIEGYVDASGKVRHTVARLYEIPRRTNP